VRNAAGLLLVTTVAACVSTGGQPKASQRPVPGSSVSTLAAFAVTADPVVIAPEVLEGFQFLYRFVAETEFVLCLEGTRARGRLHITGFRLARMRSTSSHWAAYEQCVNQDYVGTAHNHPPTQPGEPLCYQSSADQKSFGLDRQALVDIVLCGESKYLWVLKDGRSRIENGAPI
jgi:hypothetical protein